jgi:upstream activation factor subunit UAF30
MPDNKSNRDPAAGPVKKTPRPPSAAFMKPMAPSLALAAIVGSAPLPRTEITRRIWSYIREHQLQDAQNRRLIRADGNLKAVFNGQEAVNMFELTKLVNQHLSNPAATQIPPASAPP